MQGQGKSQGQDQQHGDGCHAISIDVLFHVAPANVIVFYLPCSHMDGLLPRERVETLPASENASTCLDMVETSVSSTISLVKINQEALRVDGTYL